LNRIALYFTEQRSARKTNAKKSLDLYVIRKTDKMSIQSQPTPCSLKTEKKAHRAKENEYDRPEPADSGSDRSAVKPRK